MVAIESREGCGRLARSAMNRVEFVELHPKLFHMASDGAWPSIQRLGLLSATAILDLAGIDGE